MSKLTQWLDAVDARANAATPGPWFDQYEYDGARTVCSMRSVDVTFCVNKAIHAPGEPPYGATKENGRFIAASRTDVPRLVRLVKALLLERERADAPRVQGHMAAYLEACVATDAVIAEIEATL
jgi:hypothetical protein